MIGPQGILEDYKHCTGCFSCYNICPADAIHIVPDQNGFLYPSINEISCIHCDKCNTVCPVLHNETQNNAPDCFWGFSNKYQMSCSSGGIFGELASSFLNSGGIVVGAAFDDTLTLKETIIDSIDDLPKILKSKYIQSNVGRTWSDIGELLLIGKKVLFCGTPCQVAGLLRYLKISKIDNSSLFTIDLICHGVPSQALFDKFLNEEFSNPPSLVEFRNKNKFGWVSSHPLYVEFSNGKKGYRKGLNNPYVRSFLNNLSLRESCFSCQFYKSPRQADLTLGDYWGYKQIDPKSLGVSTILVNNKKGSELLSDLQKLGVVLHHCDFETIKQSNLYRSSKRHPKYDMFFELLKNNSIYKSFRCCTDEKDIGLVVMPGKNYGNNLTNWALFTFLKRKGFSVTIITRGDHTIAHSFSKSPYSRDDYSVYPTSSEANNHCKIFILGSDQVLRSKFIPPDYFNLLPWADSDKYLMTYASSFGVDRFEGDEVKTKIVRYLLSRFDSISIREQSGLELLSKIFKRTGHHVVDPVFLLEKEDYIHLEKNIHNRIPESDYIGVYTIVDSKSNAKLIQNLSNMTKINEIYGIGNIGSPISCQIVKSLNNAKIEELIYLINHCTIFATDSFHGMCLAIILNKPFYLLDIASHSPTRLINLLNCLKINDRCYSNGYSSNDIDYDSINSLLSEFKKESINWLISEINKGLQSDKDYSDYDIIKKLFIEGAFER